MEFGWVAIGPEGAFEVVQADGRPDGREGVTAIERFEDLEAWRSRHAALVAHRGYLGTRVYRRGDELVAVSRWSSPLMVARARRGVEFDAALYLVVD